jgi:hypothetical protein
LCSFKLLKTHLWLEKHVSSYAWQLSVEETKIKPINKLVEEKQWLEKNLIWGGRRIGDREISYKPFCFGKNYRIHQTMTTTNLKLEPQKPYLFPICFIPEHLTNQTQERKMKIKQTKMNRMIKNKIKWISVCLSHTTPHLRSIQLELLNQWGTSNVDQLPFWGKIGVSMPGIYP